MRVIDLGKVMISVKPMSETATSIEILCDNRKIKVTGTTGADETVDQLGQRLKGMLRALYNSPVKEGPKLPVEAKIE